MKRANLLTADLNVEQSRAGFAWRGARLGDHTINTGSPAFKQATGACGFAH
ncbi:MAG: hypothetical protein ACR2MK_09510 [Solirubrobacteraceae bacterium]